MDPIKTALTIAGSDPSGGAGIQSDLKTFSKLRVYGMAVIAAMTAQSTLGVEAVAEVPPDFVEQQLETLLSDIRPGATKTGMLLTADVIEVVAITLKRHQIESLIVDPVMVSTSGAMLLQPDAVKTFRRVLIPMAFVLTPNINEASTITGTTIQTIGDMERSARQIHEMGARHVLIKGGHLAGDDATDVLFDGKEFSHFQSPRMHTKHTHGTGCVLSASITAYVALGLPIQKAVAQAKVFVTDAIRNGLEIGHGSGPCDPLGLGG